MGKVMLGEAWTTRRVPKAEGVPLAAATPSVVC